MTDPAPHFPDAAAREAVRSLLASVGYREGPLREQLNVPKGASTLSLGAAVLRDRLGHVPPALRTLLSFFFLDNRVSKTEARDSLGGAAVDALLTSGLLAAADDDGLRATVRLSAVGDRVFASDLARRHRDQEADFVLGPGGVTRRLADFTIRRPVESVLDLGCGAGILAALTASHAERVVATDINERAVAFTRFNADLNGLEHMEGRTGSLFEPVADERFDLILCNPPYVISPTSTFVYRDGGTELCRQIVAEAPSHLTAAGTLQMMVEWPQRKGEEWQDEVASWFAASPCHAWVLRLYTLDAASYANTWLRQQHADGDIPDSAHDEWMDHLAALDIESVGGGLILMQPATDEAPLRVLRDAPPVAEGPAGESLAHWLASQKLMAGLSDASDILDVPLAPSPALERRDSRRPTGNGWAGGKPQLRLLEGFRFGAKVDPVAAEIVGLLDGERTPRQALTHFARSQGVPEDPFVGGLPGALLRLVELGLLVPLDDQRRNGAT